MKRNDAIEHFKQKIERDPKDPDGYHNLGVLLLGQGLETEYIKYCRIALLANPTGSALHNEIGCAMLSRNKRFLAKEHFSEALRSSGNKNVEAHINLSAMFSQDNSLREALVHAEAAVALAPHRSIVHRNAATLLEAMGRTTESLSHLKKAIALMSKNGEYIDPKMYKKIAVQSVVKGQRSQAHKYCDAYRKFAGKKFDLRI